MTIAFPRITVRGVAVLMLLAGASLGVLLEKALWAEPPRPAEAVLDEAIEYKVRLYVDYYHLDARGTDRVRQRLQAHDRAVTELYRSLRQKNAQEFDLLRDETDRVLTQILKEEVGNRAKDAVPKERPPK
jgi:hypothetical protein